MIRVTTLIGITLFLFDPPLLAQSADPTAGLDDCFRQGRLADKICEGQTDSRARLDCFKKTRDAQLECLTHILPGESTAATPPSRETVPSPPSISSNEPPNNPAEQAGSTERTTAPREVPPSPPSVSSNEPPNGPAEPAGSTERTAAPREAPPSPPAASSNEPLNSRAEQTGSTERAAPQRDFGSTDSSADANAGPGAPEFSSTSGEATTRVPSSTQAPSKSQAMEKDSEPPESRWIVSETTSPIDYSPLVTAVLQATQPGDNGPVSLTIRCRARHTELSLQFRGDSAWRNEPLIYFQIEDQPPTLLDWSWSPDGKIATFKNDAVPFLQFLRDGAALKLWARDRARQSTAFQLVGLDGIRRKVAAACNWAPQQAQKSSGRK